MKRQINRFLFVNFEKQEVATQKRKIKRLLSEGYEFYPSPAQSFMIEKDLKKYNLI